MLLGGLILLSHSPIDRQLKRILSADNPTMAPLSWTGKVAFVDKVSWVPRTTCTSILDMICTHRIDVWYIYVYLPTFTWSLSVFHRWIYHTLILWSTCIYNWNPVDLYVFHWETTSLLQGEFKSQNLFGKCGDLPGIGILGFGIPEWWCHEVFNFCDVTLKSIFLEKMKWWCTWNS